jgi:hypothetical protein
MTAWRINKRLLKDMQHAYDAKRRSCGDDHGESFGDRRGAESH